MTAVLARSGGAFFVVGCFCYGLSAITGWPGFEQCFWEVVRFTLMAAGLTGGFAALVLAAAWLLTEHSPIPAVRSHWAHRLAPIRRKDTS